MKARLFFNLVKGLSSFFVAPSIVCVLIALAFGGVSLMQDSILSPQVLFTKLNLYILGAGFSSGVCFLYVDIRKKMLVRYDLYIVLAGIAASAVAFYYAGDFWATTSKHNWWIVLGTVVVSALISFAVWKFASYRIKKRMLQISPLIEQFRKTRDFAKRLCKNLEDMEAYFDGNMSMIDHHRHDYRCLLASLSEFSTLMVGYKAVFNNHLWKNAITRIGKTSKDAENKLQSLAKSVQELHDEVRTKKTEEEKTLWEWLKTTNDVAKEITSEPSPTTT